MKIGSLFDGSGGFPLAASLCGIRPAWASEVEPYPIAVTQSRFPWMKHLGSVTDVRGGEIEPVDIITFGSPCQDMSVAGKRAGLKHEANGDGETTRSGLFMEAVRIIKEMREATDGVYPAFAVWENVPGAFSSNKGADFGVVLHELAKIAEPDAPDVPMPKKGWPYAGLLLGDGWSLGYRTFDAQFWGVPQRRRRIYLVTDFRGQRAGKILFERPGLRGYFETSGTPGKGAAANPESGAGSGDFRGGNCLTPWDNQSRRIYGCDGIFPTVSARDSSGQNQQGVCVPILLDDQGGSFINVRTDGIAPTLRAETHGNLPCVIQAAGFKAGQGGKARGIGWAEEQSPTLTAGAGGNGVPSVCAIYDARGNGDGKTASTITGDHENRVTDYTNVVCVQGNVIDRPENAKCNGTGWREDTCYTLNTVDRPGVAYAMATGQANACTLRERSGKPGGGKGSLIQKEKSATLSQVNDQTVFQPIVFGKEAYNSGENATGGSYISAEGPAPTLRTGAPTGVCVRYIVRRLTETECARLQGFPDWWGDVTPLDTKNPEEVAFWRRVYQTECEIKGKKPQKTILEDNGKLAAWNDKLHTSSAEYKMWGNGIALPNALYVMQGIFDALREGLNENRSD